MVLAELFPLVNTDRGRQALFRDAQLGRADSWVTQLSNSEWQRLRLIAGSRDAQAIADELKDVFVGEVPAPRVLPQLQKACAIWMAHAVGTLRQGLPRLRTFLQREAVKWMKAHRRRGKQKHPRLYATMFAYDAKAAFLTTYANAWLHLLPQLRQQFTLDDTSIRLMSLAHNQPDSNHGQNIFWGQVLALHPMFGILLDDDVHRRVFGNWLDSAAKANEPIHAIDPHNPAYWEMVATILAAAHQYRHARAQKNASRCKRLPVDPTSDESGPATACTNSGIRSAWSR